MREAGLDGVLATQNADVFYLSGVVQQAQLYLPVEGQPVLMVRKHFDRARLTTGLDESLVVGIRSLRELPGLLEGAGGRPRRLGLSLIPCRTTPTGFAKALLRLKLSW